MSEYHAPLADMEFVLNNIADMRGLFELPCYSDFDSELVSGVLDESDRFCSEVLAPLNKVGDENPCTLDDGEVTTAPGWVDAYGKFIDAGWNGLAFAPESGGQGLPWLVATAVQEMWHSANMSFGLCPLLTQGAIRALELHGTDDQKRIYLERLVSGQWAGTMNLTEAHAGSDLSAIRTKAVDNGDHYRITGQKTFITYGEHDLTENIIHFVLARASDSPEGVRGISLFIVPKYLVDEDGGMGERNDLRCVSLEHKLGIHASPTAVMSYGDDGGAVGHLVGEKNRGLEYMFTMMNLARHAVGVEGLAVAERAYQQAREFARMRIQGASRSSSGERVAIINHPDVRRMLFTMKCMIEAMRCVAYYASSVFDMSCKHPDAQERDRYESELNILIPVVKGWCAELGNEVASLGVQVHGGMGFIEETGAAQYLRDARITPIYEGTTGIQANDLINRKVLRDEGESMRAFTASVRQSMKEMDAERSEPQIFAAASDGIERLEHVTDWVLTAGKTDPDLPTATSVSYLHLLGYVIGGWLMAKSAHAASMALGEEDRDENFLNAKIATSDYYAAHIMPRARACADACVDSSELIMSIGEEQF